MYAYIEGGLTYKSPSQLYLLAGGVAYDVQITLQTYEVVRHLEQCRLYMHVQIKEDAWVLYGFANEQERATFRLLLSINGVGAATARLILSSLSSQEFEQAVASENVTLLQRVKGIGTKTAQRIVLELKGKVGFGKGINETVAGSLHNTAISDALLALVNLGISRAVAETALKKIKDAEELSVEDLIKQALRVL